MLPTRIQSWTPWRDGMSPVSSDARAGEHTGDVQKKLANRMPRCARRSSAGVLISAFPAQPIAQAPWSSLRMNRTFGRAASTLATRVFSSLQCALRLTVGTSRRYFAQSIVPPAAPRCNRALPEPPGMTNKRKFTIYDLADLAGVSASTVSAVLNGNWQQRRIADSTAARVQQLAATHKYSVNRQASGLRKSRSGLIGMIIPMHDNRFFSGMSQVFEKLARAASLVSDRRQHAARSRARARDRQHAHLLPDRVPRRRGRDRPGFDQPRLPQPRHSSRERRPAGNEGRFGDQRQLLGCAATCERTDRSIGAFRVAQAQQALFCRRHRDRLRDAAADGRFRRCRDGTLRARRPRPDRRVRLRGESRRSRRSRAIRTARAGCRARCSSIRRLRWRASSVSSRHCRLPRSSSARSGATTGTRSQAC